MYIVKVTYSISDPIETMVYRDRYLRQFTCCVEGVSYRLTQFRDHALLFSEPVAAWICRMIGGLGDMATMEMVDV